MLCGDVTVIASDRTDTVVEVRPTDQSKKDDVRAAEQAQVDFVAGNLTVKTPEPHGTGGPAEAGRGDHAGVRAKLVRQHPGRGRNALSRSVLRLFGDVVII